ncbi:MAG: hypothetical protein WC613_06160 [Candidatus Aenigmatarchaeota archaeon]
MITIYFFSDIESRERVRNVADVFVSSDAIRCDVCYDVVRNAVKSGRTFIALGNPDTFVAVDDYLCREGFYDSHDVSIFGAREDFFEAYEQERPLVVLTDDLDFAKHLRKLEAVQ